MTPRLSVIGASIKKLFEAVGGAGDLYWDSVVAAMKMENKDDPLWKKTVLAMPMDTPDQHWNNVALAMSMEAGAETNILSGLSSGSFTLSSTSNVDATKVNNGVQLTTVNVLAEYFLRTLDNSTGNNNGVYMQATLPSPAAVKKAQISCYTGTMCIFNWEVSCETSPGVWTVVHTQANAGSVTGDNYDYQTLEFNSSGTYVSDKWRMTVRNWNASSPNNLYCGEWRLLASALGDTHWDNVTLACRFSGTNGSTSFVDLKGSTLTAASASISTSDSKFGGSSGYFAGVIDSTRVTSNNTNAMAFGTGDFTIEAWIKPEPVPHNSAYIITPGHGDVYSVGIRIWLTKTTGAIAASMPGVGSTITTGHSSLIDGAWHHFAVVRNSGTLTIYVDGTARASTTYTGTLDGTGQPTCIGGDTWYTSSVYKGYIDDLRITAGVARYTSNFSVPTSEIPASSGATVSDLKGKTITSVNGAGVNTSVYAVGAGSCSFNGTNQYLTLPDNADWNLGSGDFTIETWFRTSNVASNQAIVSHLDLQTSPFKGWAFRYDPAASPAGLRFTAFGTDAGNDRDILQVPWTPQANTWYHLAVVRSGNTVAIMVDGRQMGATLLNLATTISYASGRLLHIGAQDDTGTILFYLNGYLDDLRITKGVARYTIQQITGDPHWSSVSLLMHMNGVNNGTAFPEAKGKVVTRTGDAKTLTATRKLGTASAYFDGSGSYLTVPYSSDFEVGANDVTVEFWVQPISTPATPMRIMGFASSGGGTLGWSINRTVTGTVSVTLYSGTYQSLISATSVPNGLWSHIAFTKAGAVCRLFINGALVATETLNVNNLATSGNFAVGRMGDYAADYFNGYIDELRITKGVARYTKNFAPHHYAWPEVAGNAEYPRNTLIYSPSKLPFTTPVNGNFVDLIGKTATVTGTPSLNTTTKKFGHSSAQFNGTTDYLSFASHADFGFGTGTYTIEMWINTAATDGVILDMRSALANPHSTLAVSSGKLAIWNGSNWLRGATSVNTGAWWHVAVVRNRNVITVYLNGLVEIYLPSTVDLGTSRPARIGAAFDGTGFYAGYVDDLRITKGAVRYAGEFTPAAYPFMHPGNRPLFLEEKTLSILPVSNTTMGPGRFGTAAYFDGNNDRLQLPINASLNVGTSDFTIEMYIYRLGATAVGTAVWFLLDARTNGLNELQIVAASADNLIYAGHNAVANGVTTTTIATGSWYHVAVVRSGNTITNFINGVAEGSYSFTGSVNLSGAWLGGRYEPSGGDLRTFNGYIDDLRITKVARYVSNFTPPSKTIPTYGQQNVDPHFNNVVLLMHMDGADNGTTFTDITGKTVTPTSVVTKTAVKKFGTASAYFNGASYATVPYSADFDFGIGDVTIECWVYITATSPTGADIATTNAASNGWGLRINSAMQPRFIWNIGGVSSQAGTTDALALNTWYHLAGVRHGSDTYLFVNGAKVSTVACGTGSQNVTSAPLTIGRNNTNSSWYLTGYIDELRITKGVARYTANFQPLQIPFAEKAFDPLPIVADPHLSNVILGMHMDGANDGTVFTEFTGKTVTRTGAVTKTAVKKYGTASAYFDGAGDYLRIPYTSDFDPGTGDFTIEVWVNVAAYRTASAHICGTYTYGSVDGGTANSGWQLGIASNGTINFGVGLSGTWNLIIASSSGIGTGVWKHIAVTRSGPTVRLFIDGVQDATATSSLNISQSKSYFYVGSYLRGDALSFATDISYSGYIDDLRITKGVARYTENFVPPGVHPEVTPVMLPASDPYYASVALLMEMNGVDGGTSFAVTKGTASAAASGNAVTKTDVKKFGAASAYFDGTGDYVTLTSFGANVFDSDFTFEAWIRPAALTGDQCIFDSAPSSGGFAVFAKGANLVVTKPYTADYLTCASCLTAGQWQHIAITRINNYLIGFVNGVKITEANIGAITWSTTSPQIGSDAHGSFTGHIDDLRITKGIGRYVSSFTLPSEASPTVGQAADPHFSSVALLVPMDGIDNGTVFRDVKGKTVSRVGDVVTKVAIKKFGVSSAYFDGINDYLTVSNNVVFDFGTGDFTIEAWIRPSTTTGFQTLVARQEPGADMAMQFRLSGTVLQTVLRADGSTEVFTLSGGSINVDTWHHVAVCRASGTVYLALDGVIVNSGACSFNITPSTARDLYIGILSDGSTFIAPYAGYMDDLRITKGVARYTAAFTPPSMPHPDA